MQELNVSPTAFAQQMAFLSRNGFNAVTLEQFLDCKYQGGKPLPRTIIITLDDGYRDNYKNAFPILQKYNFKATIFVVTDYVGSDKIFQWLKLGEQSLLHSQGNKESWLPLSREEILDMSAKGICFGSHTKSHSSLDESDESSVMEELRDSKEYLEKLLSKSIDCFCYPYGNVTESVKSLVKATGYRAAVGGKGGSNTLEGDFFELRNTLINGQDSLGKFVKKVEGAYDWFEYLLTVVGFIKRVLFQPQRGK